MSENYVYNGTDADLVLEAPHAYAESNAYGNATGLKKMSMVRPPTAETLRTLRKILHSFNAHGRFTVVLLFLEVPTQ